MSDSLELPKFIAKSDGTIEQINNCDDCVFKKEWGKIGEMVSAILKKQIDQEPKTGRWIYGEDNPGTGRDGWFCNQCGHFEFWDYSLDMKSAKLNLPRICPTCFAKMQEVEE